ncbi:MAG: inositol monophosphatase family protein, partial [Planctomycetota bacterium]
IAGRIALQHFQQVGSGDFSSKGRSDFVSFVDKRIEDELSARIRAHHPDHVVIGEERHDDLTPPPGPCWIIDPIDGTTNFIRGISQFAVSIAFCDREAEARYAAICDPVRKEVFMAERGSGIWINEQRVSSSGHKNLQGALVSCALPFRTMDALDDIAAVMHRLQSQVGDMRRLGSAALDLAYTAVGRVDAYWELGIWPWDSAAGELMVRCAGGACSDFRGNAGDLLTRRSIIAAATPELHQALLDEIRPALAPWLDHPAYALR